MSDLGPGFIPTAIDDGTMVGNRGDQPGGALVWPAGADAPQELGTVPDSTARAREIAGDHIVGWLEGPDGHHAARFTPPPPWHGAVALTFAPPSGPMTFSKG